MLVFSLFSPLLAWLHHLHHRGFKVDYLFAPFFIFRFNELHKLHHAVANTPNDFGHPTKGESVYKNILINIWIEMDGAVFQFLFFVLFHILTGFKIMPFCIFSGIWMRVFNYCHHYGLEKLGFPRIAWEDKHSWMSWAYANADAHSTHHVAPSCKLSEMIAKKSTPKLPYNLFLCAIISLFPPLWFKIMDARLNEYISK